MALMALIASTVYPPFDYRIKSHLTQEKGVVMLQETDPDMTVSVQEFPVEEWVVEACYMVGDTECGSACMGHFEAG